MLTKSIATTSPIRVRALEKLTKNGPYQLQIGTGVLAFSGSDAAEPFYPSDSKDPIPNGFDFILNVAGRSAASSSIQWVKYESLTESDLPRYKAIVEDNFKKVEEILTQGGRVLIHCEQGLTRSATLVALYLTGPEGLTTGDALKQLRSANNQVRPFQTALPKQTATLHSITEED